MVEAAVIGSALSYLVVGSLWGYVGLRLARRPTRPQDRAAARAFATWWLGLAAHSAIGVSFSVFLMVGITTGPLIVAGTFLAGLVIPVMFWGLLYYMVYLFTGRSFWLRPLTALYVAQGIALFLAIAYLRPVSIVSKGWFPVIQYAHESGAIFDAFVGFVFIIPAFLATAAYATLFFRIRSPAKRIRVGLVGGGIFLWIATVIALGAIPGDSDPAHILNRLIALLAATSVLIAYEPPRWLRKRLGVAELHEEVARPHDPAADAARRAALQERARELV